jgi:4-amino-4-deoxy-L-arabinose transferase-like glycosyltransferase
VNDNHDFIRFYFPVAQNILGGKGIVTETRESPYRYPPGFPLILAGVLKASGWAGLDEETALQSISFATSILTAALIFRMTSRAFGRPTAVVAALAWLTYPFYLWDTKQHSSEQPFFIVFLLLVDCLILGLGSEAPRRWRGLLAGVLVGIAALIRPVAVALSAPLCVLVLIIARRWTARGRLLFCACLVLGNLVAISPWEYYLWQKTGRFLPLSDNGPYSIWDGIALTRCITLYDGKPFPPIPDDVRSLMREVELREDAMSRSTGRIGSFLRDAAVERPLTAAKLYALKVVRCWYATFTVRFEKYSAAIQLPYVVLAAYGLAGAWRRGGPARDLALITVLIVLYFWAMTVLVVSVLRYMMPVMALLMVFVAAGVHSIASCLGTRVCLPRRMSSSRREEPDVIARKRPGAMATERGGGPILEH